MKVKHDVYGDDSQSDRLWIRLPKSVAAVIGHVATR